MLTRWCVYMVSCSHYYDGDDKGDYNNNDDENICAVKFTTIPQLIPQCACNHHQH